MAKPKKPVPEPERRRWKCDRCGTVFYSPMNPPPCLWGGCNGTPYPAPEPTA